MSRKKTSIMPRKKTVYLVLFMFLFLLLSVIAFCLFAKAWPEYFLQAAGERGVWGELPFSLLALSFLGLILGHHCGQIGWKIIYVEDRRGKHYRQEW
jgi:hypothetical protein